MDYQTLTITAERAVLATEAARARNTDADTGLAHDKDPKEVENRLTALENQ